MFFIHIFLPCFQSQTRVWEAGQREDGDAAPLYHGELFNPHIVRSAVRSSKFCIKACLCLNREICVWFHVTGCLVNPRTHQRDYDRGWGDEKVRGRRKGDMWEEDGMMREKRWKERNKDHKHRHVNNESEQGFSACRKQIIQKTIFSLHARPAMYTKTCFNSLPLYFHAFRVYHISLSAQDCVLLVSL